MTGLKTDTAAGALTIDLARLRADVDAVNRLGLVRGEPGINRISFSDQDMAGRRWMMDRMAEAGLAVRMDGVGNVYGRWQVGDGPAVVAGSHLDTVPRGGPLDGTLGACAALEAVRSMREAGLRPARPVEVLCTADEEGRFGGMLGSQAICGEVDRSWIATASDDDGTRLASALAAQGLDPATGAGLDPSGISVFLELHVEQGPVLDRAGEAVGVVDAVSGVFNWLVTFSGEANHSGTTPMDQRQDAFRGLAEFGAAIDGIVGSAGGPETRLTVGKVALSPNFPHSVAGRAAFSVVGRDVDEAVMCDLATACRQQIGRAAELHGLEIEIVEQSWLPPTRLDPAVVDRLAAIAGDAGMPARVMSSGAGHDAQTFARHVPAGLIFVPSKGGISHAPEEDTDWEDIARGATLLARAVASYAVAPG